MMKFNVHVANGLDTTVNKTALARKELQIYNKVIQDGGVQLINWGKNTQWAGRQLTVGLTVPLAAFGAAAAKAFREADQELVRWWTICSKCTRIRKSS
jgi:acyl-CoA hydrolase